MNKLSSKKIYCVLLGAVSVAILTILDQYTKWLAISHLKTRQEPVTAIAHILQFSYLENRGAAWGMFQNFQWMFIVFGLVLFFLLVFYYMRLPQTKKYIPMRILLILLVSGDIGNLIDRVIRGYVVDFLEFTFISFPVFNVADMYVTVSVALLAILLFFVYEEEDWLIFKKEKREKKEKENG